MKSQLKFRFMGLLIVIIGGVSAVLYVPNNDSEALAVIIAVIIVLGIHLIFRGTKDME